MCSSDLGALARLILAGIFAAPDAAHARNVLCGGGDGPPFWASNEVECLKGARDASRDASKQAASEAANAEKRARDAKSIADRLSEDRQALLGKSGLGGLLSDPYTLGTLAAAAAAINAYQRSQNEPEGPVPKTKGALAGGANPADRKSTRLNSSH